MDIQTSFLKTLGFGWRLDVTLQQEGMWLD